MTATALKSGEVCIWCEGRGKREMTVFKPMRHKRLVTCDKCEGTGRR